MNKFSIHSIAVKYFFTILFLTVVPLYIFFLLARTTNFNTKLEQKQNSDLAVLNILSGNLSTLMESIQTIGRLAARDPEIENYLSEACGASKKRGKICYKEMDNRPYLQEYADASDLILSMSLMDPEYFFVGEQTLTLNRLTYYFNSATMESIFTSPLDSLWSKTFSVEFLSDGSVHKVFSLLVPCTDHDGRILGYVVLFIGTSVLDDLLNAYSDDVYIIEGDHIIGSRRGEASSGTLFTELQVSYSLLLEDSGVIIQRPDDSLVVTSRFFSPLDIHLLLVSSYRELEQQLTSFYPSLVSFVTYGIFLSLLIAFVITRFQTRHIVLLKDLMNQVSSGDLSVRYKLRGRDEIADLGHAFNSLLDRIQALLRQQEENQAARRRMELQMIHEQVKPHFLYNILEMINSMIRCRMPQESLSAIENLASYYRISLNSGSDIISIEQEVKLTENYLRLQKLRYIEFMDYILAVSPDIRKYTIPKLTLQPLVENSIYHGIKEKGEKGIVCVSGYLMDERIVLEIFDSGVGMDPETLKRLRRTVSSDSSRPEGHFGLASVIQRLNILHEGAATMTIDSSQNEFTCIILSFPAKIREQKD